MMPLPVTTVNTGIPRVLHQIWVGGKPPGWVWSNWARWDAFMEENHPEWEIHRWLDQDMEEVPWLRRIGEEAALRHLPARGLADLIRVAAVSFLGGVYMDSDTVPLRPLDKYVGLRQGWIGTYPLSRGQRVINNSSFGFPPAHPFLSSVWTMANEALERGLTNEHFVAGPRVFYKAWRSMPDSVDVDFHWEHVETGPVVTTMKRIGEYDLAALREEFPHAPVLHVLCNYGDWKGRTSDE